MKEFYKAISQYLNLSEASSVEAKLLATIKNESPEIAIYIEHFKYYLSGGMLGSVASSLPSFALNILAAVCEEDRGKTTELPHFESQLERDFWNLELDYASLIQGHLGEFSPESSRFSEFSDRFARSLLKEIESYAKNRDFYKYERSLQNLRELCERADLDSIKPSLDLIEGRQAFERGDYELSRTLINHARKSASPFLAPVLEDLSNLSALVNLRLGEYKYFQQDLEIIRKLASKNSEFFALVVETYFFCDTYQLEDVVKNLRKLELINVDSNSKKLIRYQLKSYLEFKLMYLDRFNSSSDRPPTSSEIYDSEFAFSVNLFMDEVVAQKFQLSDKLVEKAQILKGKFVKWEMPYNLYLVKEIEFLLEIQSNLSADKLLQAAYELVALARKSHFEACEYRYLLYISLTQPHNFPKADLVRLEELDLKFKSFLGDKTDFSPFHSIEMATAFEVALEINWRDYKVLSHGRVLGTLDPKALTTKLLEFLYKSRCVVNTDEIVLEIWKARFEDPAEAASKVYGLVGAARDVLSKLGAQGEFIVNIQGQGYQLNLSRPSTKLVEKDVKFKLFFQGLNVGDLISSQDLVQRLGIGTRQAQRDLSRFEELGLIELSHVEGRKKLYKLLRHS